jgi:hypothetical protein
MTNYADSWLNKSLVEIPSDVIKHGWLENVLHLNNLMDIISKITIA